MATFFLPAVALGDGPERRAAWLDLYVNGAAHAPALVELAGDDVLVPSEDLARAGVRAGGAGPVSLRALAPALSFEVDESAPALRLRVDATLLGRREVDLGPSTRPQGLEVRSDPAAFLNYAVQAADSGTAAAHVEAGATAGRWRATSGLSRDTSGWTRGLSAAVAEDPARLLQLTAGDAPGDGGPLGGALLLGGLSLRRDFGLDPYRSFTPHPSTQAVALTPSTLDLYVNGVLVRREQVGPGTLDLTNLPAAAGHGEVRAVLRDAFGRSQEFASTHYAPAGLLAPGLTDFGYHAGFERRSLGSDSFDYGRPIFIGRHRIGVSEALTLGARLDAGLDRLSGGGSVATASRLGELELAAAASGSGGAPGAAASAAWSWRSRKLGATLVARGQSAHYVNASLAAVQDRISAELAATLVAPLARSASLFLDGGVSRWRDAGSAARARATVGFPLVFGATLHVGGGAAIEGGRVSPAGQLLLAWSAGPRQSTQLAVASQGHELTARATAQQSTPRGRGLGYRVEAANGGAVRSGTGELVWQGDAARFEGVVERRALGQSARLGLAGAVVAMRREIFLSRPIQDSFALVEVGGVSGVRASLEGEEIGRTGERGRLLVAGLSPHQANRIAIRAADLPLDYELGALERMVAPPRRGAALVAFDVRKVRAVTGRVALRGDAAPGASAGELRLDEAGGEASPLGTDGRFYLTTAAAGRHAAVVEHAAGVCHVALDVPESSALVVDLGVLQCAEERATTAAETPASGPPSASTVTNRVPVGALAGAN